MRIVQVVDSLGIGGAERHVVDLALALDREGHRVTVACSTNGPLVEHLAGTGGRVRSLLGREVKRRVSPDFAWALRTLFRQEQPDLVHAHLYASAAAAALAGVGNRVPLVVTEHSEAHWQGRQQRWVHRWAGSQADHVIAVSSGIQQRVIDELRVPPTRVSLIPNAIARCTEADRRSVHMLQRYRHGSGPLIGVVARMVPEKGHHVLLAAVARIVSRVSQARFVVIGDGDRRLALQEQARQLGIDDRVHFLGEIGGARALIGSLDLLVVPSLHEGTPLVVLEALSAGVPVIASRVGDVPRQVQHQRNGLLVPPGDVPALADALASVLLDPGLYRHLHLGAARHVYTDDYARMLRQVTAVYDTVLEHAPLPTSRQTVPQHVR